MNGYKRYKRYGKRRYGKRRGYRPRKRRGVSFAKRVLNIVRNQDSNPKITKVRFFAGITAGLVADKSVPVPGRTAVFGRCNWKNPSVLGTWLQLVDGEAPVQGKTYVKRYFEKHTLQNAGMFPVVVTCYEFYNPNESPVSTAGGLASTFPATAAAEIAAYGTTVPVDNSQSDKTTSRFMWPIWELFKYNLYDNALVDTGEITDAKRSWCTDDAYGNVHKIACMQRMAGLISFKIPEMREVIRFRKKSIVTLMPGQQKSYLFKRKNQILDYDDSNNARTTFLAKGAAGLVFHTVGLMSHDTATTGTTLQAVQRSSWVLNYECNVRVDHRHLLMEEQVWEKDATLLEQGTAFTNAEVRSGLATTEFQLT